MLEAEGLVKRYGQVTALDGFTLSVAPGEITGLVGHNGAGKTTFTRIVAGLAAPTTAAALLHRPPLLLLDEPTAGVDPQTRHNLLLRRRDPPNLITYMIIPVILIALFKPVLTRLMPDGTAQDVTGMLVLSSTLTLQIVGMSLLSERTWKTWEMLRTTPASAAELLTGKALPVLAVLLLQQAAVIGYGVAAAGLSVTGPPFLLLLALLVWSLTLLAAGSLLATLVRSHSQLAVLTDTGAIAISTLAGALLPLSMMPAIARHLAPASPGYWAISMLKAAARGDTAGTLAPAAVLGAIAVVAGATACLRLRRGLAQLRT